VSVELGGQYIGPTEDVVLELIKELGLKTFPTFTERRGADRLRRKTSYAVPTPPASPRGGDGDRPALGAAGAMVSSGHHHAPRQTEGAEDPDGATRGTEAR
jgi:monoamine oxidase